MGVYEEIKKTYFVSTLLFISEVPVLSVYLWIDWEKNENHSQDQVDRT